MMHGEDTMHSDVLIIGSGLAGLAAALSLPEELAITVLCKDTAETCASAWAQGGIAAVMDEAGDSIEAHVQDTLVAGAGLCHEPAVRALLAQGPAAIAWLQEAGVRFDQLDDASALHLTREGGHSQRRIVHVADRTGQAVHAALLARCRARPNIQLRAGHTAFDLLTNTNEFGKTFCAGAWVLQPEGPPRAFTARHTVLATGGLGQVFSHTTNPPQATGDGVAMAWRAGCRITDMEFIQFHPTALHIDGRAAGLITEALRGEGARLLLPGGERFMPRHDERAELAPRDIVARAIWSEMQERALSHVLLDISHQPRAWLAAHFPQVTQLCARHGIDIAVDPIPVAPCAHYACGGVRADVDGTTDVTGLHAIGEVACTGLHGANRLASNSLLECVVMARAMALKIASMIAHEAPQPMHADMRLSRPPPALGPSTAATTEAHTVCQAARHRELQALMSSAAGMVRSADALDHATRRLQAMRSELSASDHALANRIDVCMLIIDAARRRPLSRGTHTRIDEQAAIVA